MGSGTIPKCQLPHAHLSAPPRSRRSNPFNSGFQDRIPTRDKLCPNQRQRSHSQNYMCRSMEKTNQKPTDAKCFAMSAHWSTNFLRYLGTRNKISMTRNHSKIQLLRNHSHLSHGHVSDTKALTEWPMMCGSSCQTQNSKIPALTSDTRRRQGKTAPAHLFPHIAWTMDHTSRFHAANLYRAA